MEEKHLSITTTSVEFGVALGSRNGSGRRLRYLAAESWECHTSALSERLMSDM